MTNVIPMFAFNDQQLRATIIDGEPWFVAADACRILGWPIGQAHGGTTQHLRGLDGDEKRTIRRAEGLSIPLFTGTPASAITFISRPGLFKLIQRSNKPEAKAFDRWVRHEVLPQIMDNGGYMTRDADVRAVTEAAPANSSINDLDLLNQMLTAMTAAKARIEELEEAKRQAEPKVAFVDQYVAAGTAMAFDTVARTLGLGCAKELCALLRENDVLFYRKIGGQNVNIARKEHLDAGRFTQKTFTHSAGVTVQTRVTPLGVTWLADRLPRFIGKRAEREAREARNAASRAALAAALKAAA